MTQLLTPDIDSEAPVWDDEPGSTDSRALPPLPSPGRIPASARPSEARAAAAARLFRAARTDSDSGPARIPIASRPSEARAAAAARLFGGAGSAPGSAAGRMTNAARAARLAVLMQVGRPALAAPESASARSGSEGSTGAAGGSPSAGGVGGPTPAPRRATSAGGAATAVAVAPAEPEPEQQRHLRVVEAPVRTPAQRRRRARILLATAASVAVVVAFGLVYLHVVLAQRQFALDKLNAQVQTAQANYQRLRLQVAELGSPQHVISNAEGRLGMSQPTAVTYVTPTTQVPGTSVAPSTSQRSTSGVTQAPAGDADWPSIKSQLAGSP
jgi:cell division protein FtsL